jgi:hypothetical protein
MTQNTKTIVHKTLYKIKNNSPLNITQNTKTIVHKTLHKILKQ